MAVLLSLWEFTIPKKFTKLAFKKRLFRLVKGWSLVEFL